VVQSPTRPNSTGNDEEAVYSNVLFADVGELEKSAKEIVNKMDKSFLR
jgi:hypothetical protein